MNAVDVVAAELGHGTSTEVHAAFGDEARRIAERIVARLIESGWHHHGAPGVTHGAAAGRERPASIVEHLQEAERLLAFAFTDNDPESAPGGYYVDDDHCNAQVRAAEVHARIAHAAAAAGLLQPAEEVVRREDMPGLNALERLATAMETIAENMPGWSVRSSS